MPKLKSHFSIDVFLYIRTSFPKNTYGGLLLLIQFDKTHSSQVFHIPKVRTSKFGIYMLTYHSAEIWNQL